MVEEGDVRPNCAWLGITWCIASVDLSVRGIEKLR